MLLCCADAGVGEEGEFNRRLAAVRVFAERGLAELMIGTLERLLKRSYQYREVGRGEESEA